MGEREQPVGGLRQRIDKWLFFARLAKSRSLAQSKILSGHVKINGVTSKQPSRLVGPGDRIDIALERRSLVVIIKACGERRGPFEQARLLYDDVSPPQEEREAVSLYEQAQRAPGAGRPTKKERREVDRVLGRDLWDAE